MDFWKENRRWGKDVVRLGARVNDRARPIVMVETLNNATAEAVGLFYSIVRAPYRRAVHRRLIE